MGKQTILVMEDHSPVRKLISLTLQRAGYEVLEGVNGSQGVEIARNHSGSIDLIFSDIMMPVMGGFEAATEIIKDRPDVPVIFCTGCVPPQDLTDNKWRNGKEVFLQKPVAPKDIVGAVRSFLRT